ncbi:hypothetical protein RFI_23951 [Reticulomyxa filosa]|uniref:Endonuclease/exonuclease/phosphatase domain-containing protein n=1 Tax=Reticulomyxa filosa TaxID=46433 RepID=X6MHF8_RETFI|nr:hypothetical protein RFI_23951 [Reticulomyxa filosa]|eukprot:ETO13423.1 hypothetical protein RFI_23951 [Reticulomyxa filosa]
MSAIKDSYFLCFLPFLQESNKKHYFCVKQTINGKMKDQRFDHALKKKSNKNKKKKNEKKSKKRVKKGERKKKIENTKYIKIKFVMTTIEDSMFDVVENGERPLPGQVVFPLTYDLEKDLLECRKRFGNEYAELMEQKFVETIATMSSNNDGSSGGHDNSDAITFSVSQWNMLADGDICKHKLSLYLCLYVMNIELCIICVNQNCLELNVIILNKMCCAEVDTAKSFVGVDKACLRWSYRGLRIVEALYQRNTDLVCIEECDQDEFLIKYLTKKGYECYYQRKHKAPAQKVIEELRQDRKASKNELPSNFVLNNDGILLAFKMDKFALKTKPIRISDKDNTAKVVALALHLEHIANPCLQFLFKGQIQLLFEKLLPASFASYSTKEEEDKGKSKTKSKGKEKDKEKDKCPNSLRFPVLLCCDLNATPKKSEKAAGTVEPLCYQQLTREMGFVSAYVQGQLTEPPFTTFKSRQHGIDKHTIDYIFTRDFPCRITHLLQLTSPPNVVIPHWTYPSDHFAIGCILQWRGTLAAAKKSDQVRLSVDLAEKVKQINPPASVNKNNNTSEAANSFDASNNSASRQNAFLQRNVRALIEQKQNLDNNIGQQTKVLSEFQALCQLLKDQVNDANMEALRCKQFNNQLTEFQSLQKSSLFPSYFAAEQDDDEDTHNDDDENDNKTD